MKGSILIFLFVAVLLANVRSQINISRIDGGSLTLKLGFGVSVNENSSLHREWISINDESCPVQLIDVGIEPAYVSSKYSFKPRGSVEVKDSVTALKFHHVLYDVFGEHIKSLDFTSVTDVSIGTAGFPKYTSWYARENQVEELFVVVSYVAYVRLKSGEVWRYNPIEIKEELHKVKIGYDIEYIPKNED